MMDLLLKIGTIQAHFRERACLDW